MASHQAAGPNDARVGREPAGGFVSGAARLLRSRSLRYAALAVVVALQGVLFLSGYRLTPDQLALHAVSMRGFEAILTESVAAAVVSGRFCFFFSPLSYYAELLSDYFVVRALFVGVYFGLLWAFAAYWARLVRAEAATLLLLLLVSLQILDFNNLPPNSFTIAFTLPALLLVCSRLILLPDDALSQASTAKRLALFAVVLAAYLASDYVFIFGVSLLLLEYALAWWRGQGGLVAKGKALLRRKNTWFDAAPVALAALAYGGWRLLHPPAYAGTTLAATMDPALVLATAATHAVGGFTLARPDLYAVLAANASPPPGGLFPLAGVFVGSAFLGAATLHEQRGLAFGKRLAAACLGLAFFVVLPLALSPKYQQLQLEHLPAYVDSRFAFLWATAALACLVCLLGKHLGHGARRLALSVLFGLVLGAASAYTYYHNADMSQAMLEYTAAWDRAGSLAAQARNAAGASSPEAGSLNGSIAARVDPFGLVAGHPGFDLEAYWRQYVAWREARRDDAWLGVSLRLLAARPVTLTPGRLYAAAELPRRFYGRCGWYWPAAWGVYSRGERASLPFGGVTPGKDGLLAFTAGGVLAPGKDSQALEVWVNGKLLATLELAAAPAVQQVAVPGALLAGGQATFEFRLDRAFSPASLGGEDHRRLGFALINVLFVQP